jgi:hypothetical protein
MSRRTALTAISPVASEQWGMITAGQARRLGVSRQDLKRLVDDGTLAIADQAARVYRLTGVPEDPDLDPLRAAWLQLGGAKSWHERTAAPDLVISHRSAAHLRGLGDLIPHEHEFYATTRLRPRRSGIKLRVRSQIAPGSWEIWVGYRYTLCQRSLTTCSPTGRTSLQWHRSSGTPSFWASCAERRSTPSSSPTRLRMVAPTQESLSGCSSARGRVDDRAHVPVRDACGLPERFIVPDAGGWATRYPKVAAEAPGTVPDYDTAVSLASQPRERHVT